MLIAAMVGFFFGFVGSMPVAGPIAALVFARAMQGRLRSGLYIAMGGAVAEAGYAALALWGFAELLEQYPWIQQVSNAAAAVILTVLGVLFIRHQETDTQESLDERAESGFLMGFTITAFNPTLIATWTAAAAMLLSSGLVALEGSHALPFSAGAMAGIVTWFAMLLRLVAHFRERFSYASLARVIRGMGWFLLLIAAWFAYQLVG